MLSQMKRVLKLCRKFGVNKFLNSFLVLGEILYNDNDFNVKW